jgi:hypothetical protein
MRKLCFVILLIPALAWGQKAADPNTADQWYKEGENQYLLGNFDKAVEAFKQGFSLENDEGKRAVYLYNIAQSYRLGHDCERALFFYRRFIALKDNNVGKALPSKTRKEIMDWIAELENCVAKASAVSTRPPTTSVSPDGDKNERASTEEPEKEATPPSKEVASRDGGPGSDEDDRGEPEEPLPGVGGPPRMISARFNAGATKVRVGPQIPVPVQATFALIAGYPIPVNNRLTIEAGVAGTLTPVPFDRPMMQGMPAQSRTALLTSVMANAGVSYEVAPKFGLRGDVGIGGMFFSGLSESRFTNGAPTSGALTMFHVRLAASADYAFTRNIVGTVTPIAFTMSPPKEGLDDSIKRITSIDFLMLGIGYRM